MCDIFHDAFISITHIIVTSDIAPDPEGSSTLLLPSLLPPCIIQSNLFLCKGVEDIKIWLLYARQAFIADAIRTLMAPGGALFAMILLLHIELRVVQSGICNTIKLNPEQKL
jgi:hypothetical protein